MPATPASAVGPSAPEAVLPAPRGALGADVVIYDGQCRICTAQAARLARWDGRGRLAFLSLHDPEVRTRWPELSHDDLMASMYVIEPSGRQHRGADAIRYLSRRLPRLWALAPVLHVPGSAPLWRVLYRWFARQRYRFGRLSPGGAPRGCDDGACTVHFR